ncbi:MAG: DNA N-6-adenine-methyltransferase [Patescibacteria group bacterium]
MTAGRKINTVSQSWGTPHKYVQAVKEVFGGKIDLDPCSNKFSIVNADVEYSLPRHDGLEESWNYPTVYVNPPYGIDKERGTSIKRWLERCAAAYDQHGSEVIALIPVAVNTGHWKRYIFTKAKSVCFLYDTRLHFLENGLDVGKGAPMACAMVYWGRNSKKFYDVFIEHGAVIDISNLIGENIGADRKYLKLFEPSSRRAKEVRFR